MRKRVSIRHLFHAQVITFNAHTNHKIIHSRKEDPAEIFEFVQKFRLKGEYTPIVVIPTSSPKMNLRSVESMFMIYDNQLTRTGFPAMQDAARTILEHHRAK